MAQRLSDILREESKQENITCHLSAWHGWKAVDLLRADPQSLFEAHNREHNGLLSHNPPGLA